MTIADDLHQEAMKYAMRAMVARLDGSLDEAAALTRKALDCETEAANQLPIMPESEPLRASLFNRAAWLAFSIGDYERAAQLADDGLDGFVPTVELEVDLLLIRQLVRRE